MAKLSEPRRRRLLAILSATGRMGLIYSLDGSTVFSGRFGYSLDIKDVNPDGGIRS